MLKKVRPWQTVKVKTAETKALITHKKDALQCEKFLKCFAHEFGF